MSAIHPNHLATNGLVPRGFCGFYASDWVAVATFYQHQAGTCQAPAAYTATSRHLTNADDNHFDLCDTHAAHVRACSQCESWLTSIRTYGMEGVS